jgi:gamma-glutamylcyclotransferase (GGCT)/AIG2-like uncharacterized protein YtfP
MRPLWLLAIAACVAACTSTPPFTAAAAPTADCHPAPAADQPQYVVGYGSLMQGESRKRTSPQAGPAQPVQVRGFRRAWIARGDPVGFSTTFLGVAPDTQAIMTAVIYRIDTGELAATDRREAQYCRVRVPAADIRPLAQEPADLAAGQAWIYVNRPEASAAPSDRYPIVQSYVDIFVSGCLEQEERFRLDGFAQRCVATTGGWSAHWVNDRLYPRRPFLFQPRSRQIDALLSRELPAYFPQIRIEGASR